MIDSRQPPAALAGGREGAEPIGYDAGFISNGRRNPVIGCKPQVARSGNGVITGPLLPQGNAPDSGYQQEMSVLLQRFPGSGGQPHV